MKSKASGKKSNKEKKRKEKKREENQGKGNRREKKERKLKVRKRKRCPSPTQSPQIVSGSQANLRRRVMGARAPGSAGLPSEHCHRLQNKEVTRRITRVGTSEVFVHTFSKPSPDPLLRQSRRSQVNRSQLNEDLTYEMRCWLSKMAIS